MNLTAAVMATAGILLLIWTVRKINPGNILLSAALGLAALFVADLIAGFTQFNLPVNWATVICAVAGGAPGVILLLTLNAMLLN